MTNPWPWLFSLQWHWSGHLGAQDSRLPVHLFVLFRRRHLLGPHATLKVHDLTHLWAKGKRALSIRRSNPPTESQGLVRGGQAGLWPQLVPGWTPGLHSGVLGSSGGHARGQSTENQGKPPLGLLSHHHCKRTPCTGKVGETAGGWFKKKKKVEALEKLFQ